MNNKAKYVIMNAKDETKTASLYCRNNFYLGEQCYELLFATMKK